MRSKRTWYFAILVAVLACAGIALFFGSASLETGQESSSLAGDMRRIEKMFDGHTAQEALILFKQENIKQSPEAQHIGAHLFGEILYEKEGISGMSVCDGSFGFGCYHSFLGSAITDHGPDIVKQLDATCVETYGLYGTGCFHGIGHGLLSYYGYAEDDVRYALTVCSRLSWQRPLGGCADGVFMEYNFRVMEKDQSNRFRPFVIEDKYEPCASLSAYEESCYFSLAEWWESALLDDPRRAERVGEYCAEVEDVTLRRACFRGIGYGILPRVQFDTAKSAAFCDAAATGVSRVWCREGVAWGLYSDPSTRNHTEQACALGLSIEDSATCINNYLFVTQ